MWAWLSRQLHDNGEAIISLLTLHGRLGVEMGHGHVGSYLVNVGSGRADSCPVAIGGFGGFIGDCSHQVLTMVATSL